MYLGDTANKNLIINQELFDAIGVTVSDHNKLPDIVLLDKDNHRIYLIEAVTSHGPMSPKRIIELDHMFRNAPLIKVYVSAFPDFNEFKKYSSEIAWETEVWIAEVPDHMIHYNGNRYLVNE
jgi:type II restriction enzyme